MGTMLGALIKMEEVAAKMPWHKGAANPNCRSCHHQHERIGVEGGVVVYAPCKVKYLVKDREGYSDKQLRSCNCDIRS